jgi:hypothetical protein
MRNLLFILCVMLFAVSCEKSVESLDVDLQSSQHSSMVNKARVEYEKIVSSTAYKERARESEILSRKSERIVLWDKAYTKEYGSKPKLVVPFYIKRDFFLNDDNDENVSYNNISHMFVDVTESNVSFEIVTFLPEVDGGVRDLNKFSGMIYVEDLLGREVKTFKMSENGKRVRTMSSGSGQSNAKTTDETCVCQFAIYCDNSNCYSTISSCYCYEDAGPVYFPSNFYADFLNDESNFNYSINYSNTGTPGSSTGTVSGGLAYGYICPPANIASDGDYWVGNISGLGVQFVNNLTSQTATATFNLASFKIKKNGMSAASAGAIFQKAYNTALDNLTEDLASGLVDPQSNIVRQQFRFRIEKWLETFSSGSFFYLSIISGAPDNAAIRGTCN